jgi:hypothetical protein
MSARGWIQHILWIDGLAALSAGLFVLVFRTFLTGLYDLPLGIITFIGLVNLAYSAFGLTMAGRKTRRATWIAALAAANYFWAVVCLVLAVRFGPEASGLGLGTIIFEGAFVAALATIEWRMR